MSLHCLSYPWRWIRDPGASLSPGSNNALPQLSVGTVSVRTSITQDFTIVLVRQRLCSCPVHCVIAHYPFPDRITWLEAYPKSQLYQVIIRRTFLRCQVENLNSYPHLPEMAYSPQWCQKKMTVTGFKWNS